MTKAILFDLDNTLFDMRHYLVGAYEHIARYISQKYRLSFTDVSQSLDMSCAILGFNHDELFNHWLKSINIPETEVRGLVDVYHTYEPVHLFLYPGVDKLLDFFKQNNIKLGLLTDGRADTQRKKVRLLQLHRWMNHIVYSNDYNTSKPDKKVFQTLMSALNVSPDVSVYVGDHPHYDIEGARLTGMTCVRVRQGIYANLQDDENFIPDYSLSDVTELPKVLKIEE